MKKVKYIENFRHGNKSINKKGSTRSVTDRHAAWLVENKFATVVEGKEDKEAAARQTK